MSNGGKTSHLMRKVFRTLRRYFGLVLAISLLLLLAVYYRLSLLSFDGDTILYAPIVFYHKTAIYTVWAALLSFGGVLLYVLVKRPAGRQGIVYALSLVLLFIAIPCSCVASLPFIADPGTSFTHLDKVSYQGQVYQLAFTANPVFAEASYNLYRCDRLGFSCERIHSLDASRGTPYAVFGDYDAAERATLVIDDDSSLSIKINEQSLFTYDLRY